MIYLVILFLSLLNDFSFVKNKKWELEPFRSEEEKIN